MPGRRLRRRRPGVRGRHGTVPRRLRPQHPLERRAADRARRRRRARRRAV